FEAEFLDYVSREHGDLLDSVLTTGDLSDDDTATLEQAVDTFKQQFVTASGQPLVKDEPVEAMGEGEEDLTKIRRRRRTEAGIREAAAPDAGGAAEA
ncbi:MAG: hypothetical protein ACRD0W_12430, partial [Acidimicrobiales bacterium]